jgi:thymidylate synthase
MADTYTNADAAYADLIKRVMEEGEVEPNRTGTATKAVFGLSYRLDLRSGDFPLLTTKRMDGPLWNSLVHELLWFLSGEAHIRDFRDKSKIWDAWADKEGRLQTAYGRFWRRYPSPPPEHRRTEDGEVWAPPDYDAQGGVDQIANIVQALMDLRGNPASKDRRRMVLLAWHPGNAWFSKLPPCHFACVFSVVGGRLNCHLTQRSGDLGLGVPFNIASYWMLTCVLAKATGWETGTFSHTIVDAHIYCGNTTPEDPFNHEPALSKQLLRTPFPAPKLVLPDQEDLRRGGLGYLETLRPEHFVLAGYQCHPGLKMKVAV